MKGVIPQCLAEMVTTKFGAEQLKAVFVEAKLPANKVYLASEDTPDAEVMALIAATCKVLAVTTEAAAEAFGEYWCVVFVPRLYKAYYRNVTATKPFLLLMKQIHEQVTKNIPNARPPVFDFEDTAPNKLVMKYSSPRHLESIWIGCVKGAGVAFKEKLKIARLSPSAIEITFG